ncbi:alpha-E domain-containing protein [Paenibacillus glycanilyticus]|uniref:alpha-E domain-containing protein n=1 Tax=Paenibacillus glycanilyticus TaxID=126569 RepID=UPI002040C9F2|nr:alpha-E domain-containing protein [Paenibacillus glycanilyticus]MCM3629198.1 alpha-E domain-containing protein [Paenibacillus glycanilyticus]
MLNRNAEALFWIGRYMERAENHARLIDVHYHLQAEDELGVEACGKDGEWSEVPCKWTRIVDALGSRGAYEQQYGSYTEQDVLHYITLDRDNANSLVSCVSHARGNLRTLREKVPSELWDTINAFYLWLREKQPEDLMKESPHLFYGRIKEWAALFQGLCQSVMPRENEWHFIECGRFLERAENTLRIIKAVGNAAAGDGWNNTGAYPYLQAVLKSLSGHQSFRRFYADGMSVEAIVEFVILNQSFPRSVVFSFHALDEHMKQIELSDKQLRTAHDRVIRQVAKVKADLACLEHDDMIVDRNGSIIGHLLEACQTLGHSFAKTFFRMGEASA